MEAVETLLLFLVSLSVLLSLIRVHLQLNFVNVVDDNSHDQIKTRFEPVDENNFKNSQQEIIAEYKTDENSLNVDEAEKQVIGENSEEIAQGEETEWFDDDDWVGVETSELDKIFGEAMVFVSCNEDMKNMEELCELQQLVLQGPSQGPAPSNSRNTWEEVSRETAMKKYIEVLSDAIPDWKHGFTSSL